MPEISEIRWAWGPGEFRFALMAQSRPIELRLWRPGMIRGWGIRGRVVRIEAGLDAAFVELGLGERPGFLPGAKALGLSEGMAVCVRVKTDSSGAKGPKLAFAPDLPAIGPAPEILDQPHPLTLLLADHPRAEVVVDDSAARALCPAARLERDLGVDEMFDAALDPVVALPCGGRAIFEQTAALLAVDVDSGPAQPALANRQAAAEVARQLRLRGIGGQVAVDFVSGPKGTAYKMAAALKRETAADPLVHVFGVSPLGLVELTRERVGPSLAELALKRAAEPTDQTLALAALRRLLAEDRARPGARLSLVLAPEIAQVVLALDEALAETARRLGRAPDIRPDPGRSRHDALVEETRP